MFSSWCGVGIIDTFVIDVVFSLTYMQMYTFMHKLYALLYLYVLIKCLFSNIVYIYDNVY